MVLCACDETSSPDGGVDAGPPDAARVDAGPEDAGPPPDAGPPDAGSLPDAGTDAGPSTGCPPVASRTVVMVPDGVLPSSLTTWTCDNLYVLEGIVLVYAADPASPQVLTIEPGTIVRGSPDSATRGFLVVTRNGRIEAEGTADAPIVFTSNAPEGSRARDDWGGITLLGRAFAGAARRTEGFPVGTSTIADLDPFLAYGPLPGGDADDAWDCGTLRYVRVEFASFNAGGAMGNESNAVQIYSCGYDTEIDYIQTHLSGDDGIEIFGGTVDIRHVVVTGASDDLFDWDDGWRGRAQFLVGQQHGDTADFGFEAGGSGETPPVAPSPRMFNVTLVGAQTTAGQIGGRLRGASRGHLRNFILLGFRDGFLDIGGAAAAANLVTDPPLLSFRNSVFGQAGAPVAWPTGSDDAVDGDFIEPDFFTAPSQRNQVADPMLADPFDLTAPDWMPTAASSLGSTLAEAPTEEEGDTRPPFFDTSAQYIGAFEPGGEDWTLGWTAYPER